MAFKIQLRRDLALRWADNNPVLLLGEFGYEYDTGYAKIGDGQSPWADLTYFVGGTGSRGDTLVSLIDTPAEYTGAEEYYLRVNKIGNGVEFVPIATINAEIDLRGATGYEPTDAGRYLRVKPDGTGFEWYTVTGGSGGGGAFLNISPTLTDASGYAAGTSFENVILDKMWDGLLYPEEQANYKLVYIAPYPGGTGSAYDVLEVGQFMDSSLNFGWENNNEILFKSSTVNIYDIDDSLQIGTNLDETSSPEFYAYASAITKTTKASHNWRWTGMDVNEVVFNKTYAVNWYYPIFTGRSSDATLTNAQIPALANRLPQADSAGNYTFSASDDYIYICLPEGGTDYDIKGMTVNGMPLELASATDGYVSLDSAGLPYDAVSSVNINSVITTYRVYRSKFKISGALTISVSSIELVTGLNLTGTIQPISETEIYPITDTKYGIDGLRNVDDLTAMYAIPQPRRKLGMLVGVGITGSVGSYYKFTNEPGTLNTTVSDWSRFNSAVVTYGSTGAPGIVGATGFNIEPGIRLTVDLVEAPTGVANYTIDIPELISGGTA